MATLNTARFIAIFLMAGLILVSNIYVSYGQGCQGDLQGLITQCAIYVQKAGLVMDPSQGCCSVIKATDVQCACKYISKEIEAIVDMAKVVHVAQFCGKPLAHGMKCGSYTVP